MSTIQTYGSTSTNNMRLQPGESYDQTKALIKAVLDKAIA